jgi:hypothetical protein
METLSISSPWGLFIVILRQEKHVVNVIMFVEVSFTYKTPKVQRSLTSRRSPLSLEVRAR